VGSGSVSEPVPAQRCGSFNGTEWFRAVYRGTIDSSTSIMILVLSPTKGYSWFSINSLRRTRRLVSGCSFAASSSSRDSSAICSWYSWFAIHASYAAVFGFIVLISTPTSRRRCSPYTSTRSRPSSGQRTYFRTTPVRDTLNYTPTYVCLPFIPSDLRRAVWRGANRNPRWADPRTYWMRGSGFKG